MDLQYNFSGQVLKIRRTIKAIQQFRKTLPFLAAEVKKELEFIGDNPTDQKAHTRCKEVRMMIQNVCCHFLLCYFAIGDYLHFVWEDKSVPYFPYSNKYVV